MTFRDTPQDTETPAAGPFGVPLEYFGPPDGETALRADEMHANRIETEAMAALRSAIHDPATGFASRPPTERLISLPANEATLDGIGETFRAQATTPRQRAILGPLLDNHLEHAATQVGRLTEQALAEADHEIVESRIGSLQRDAAVNWDDPARLRILGRAVVTERRSQGERKNWDKDQTETRVRQNLSDFYATAIEAATDRDLDRAGKLLADAQGVLLPERQVLLARKLAEARDDKHVAGIAGTLAAIPLDPASAPLPETYRARAEELTPDDTSPELRARIAQLADTAQRHATKYWQYERNQAGVAAIDWIVANPGAPMVTMDRKIASQLSPEQRMRLQAIEAAGRLDTDPEVYARLDRLAVYEPKTFAATDLSQYRLALDGKDYARFTGFQKGNATFVRYDRGRTVLDAGLIKAGLDPDGDEARAAHGELDKTLRSFEAIEGRPPAMADIDQIAGEIVSDVPKAARSAQIIGLDDRTDGTSRASRQTDGLDTPTVNDTSTAVPGMPAGDTLTGASVKGDPNLVLAQADGGDVELAQQKQQGPVQSRGSQPALAKPPARIVRPLTAEELTTANEGRRETALNEVAIKAKREENALQWEYFLRQLPPPVFPGSKHQAPLPADWRQAVNKINPAYAKLTEEAANKYGIPAELLARLFYKESNYDMTRGFNEEDKALGIPQMFPRALKEAGYPTKESFARASAAQQIDAGAYYLSQRYKEFKDWPKAVGAYHSGDSGIRTWLSGVKSNYDTPSQVMAMSLAKGDKAKAQVASDAAVGLAQFRELQAYLPHIFLGDPKRYDGPQRK